MINRGNNKIVLLTGTVILIVLTLGMAFIFILQTQRQKPAAKTITVIAPTRSPSPTPTTIPLDKSSLKVEVLNGSGKSGTAARAVKSLKSLGYTDIIAGNADTFENNTQVSFSTDIIPAHSGQILNDIKSLYPATIISTLPPQSSSSVKLIIGRE